MNHEVVIEELGWSGAVRKYSAYRVGDKVDVVRLVDLELRIDCGLIPQVQLLSGRRENVGEAICFQLSDDRLADKPTVACHYTRESASIWIIESPEGPRKKAPARSFDRVASSRSCC